MGACAIASGVDLAGRAREGGWAREARGRARVGRSGQRPGAAGRILWRGEEDDERDAEMDGAGRGEERTKQREERGEKMSGHATSEKNRLPSFLCAVCPCLLPFSASSVISSKTKNSDQP